MGQPDLRTLIAVTTGTTCGAACWYAQEPVCRCSCGGANHGIMLMEGAEQPARTAKIDGIMYELGGVGTHPDMCHRASEFNEMMPRVVERPKQYKDYITGKLVWSQYVYRWDVTDSGAPARVKAATKSQIEKWPELEGDWDDYWNKPYLLWVRREMPPWPAEPVIDCRTGLPLEDQSMWKEQ